MVKPADGVRLGDVLARAGADERAVRDGRVFVGKRRAGSNDEPVQAGDEVRVSPPTVPTAAAVILAHEDGLVAADKPSDLGTIPDHTGAASSLLVGVARALGVLPQTLHPTSRLDRGVSGVVIFTRTDAATQRLRQARDRGTYARRYVALAAASPFDPGGEWDAPIGRARDPRHRAAFGYDPAPALTRYEVIGRAPPWTLLALEPVTGRTHQLRVHAAHAGAPLLGDRVYGGPTRVTLPTGSVLGFDRIALHAARVRVPRADGSVLEVSSPVPEELRAWWRAAAGDDGAWERALGHVFAAAART